MQFHYLFWFGDLNYRLDMSLDDVLAGVSSKDWPHLCAHDQLLASMEQERAFGGFCEGPLQFAPTYRYARGRRDEYEWKKTYPSGAVRINAPAWCDRILWRAFPNMRLAQRTYACANELITSDHSPVFASFDIQTIGQFVLANDSAIVTIKVRPNRRHFAAGCTERLGGLIADRRPSGLAGARNHL